MTQNRKWMESERGMTDARPDVALIAAAQAGDKQAIGELLSGHQRMALTLARRMVGDREVARELTQEAMLEAYLSLGNLRAPDRFQSWLYGIVLNVCRSYLRRHKQRPFSLEAILGGVYVDRVPLVARDPSPQEIVEGRELHQTVLAAVDGLSPRNRTVTMLYYYKQLSVREVAVLLDISVAAVKGRLHKSRQQLRVALAEMPGMMEFSRIEPRMNDRLLRKEREKMVRVHVIDVVVQGEDDHFVVILADEDHQRILPIWIGPAEGQVIAMHLLNKEPPRPMTHRFVADMLAALDVMVESVRVEALREITYYATVKFRHGAKEAEKSDEKVVEVDARPSDAIALALHMGCPIYAANAVIEKAGIDVPEEYQASPQQKGLEKVARLLDKRHQEHMAKLEAHREAGAGRQAKHETVARSELMDYLFGTPTE